MGKVTTEMSNLSTLLDGTSDSRASVDDMPVEIKRSPGRPKKKKQEYGVWCGLETPAEVYNVCLYLKELLEEQGKWTPALAVQVYNCAVQFFLYNDLITKMITQKEPVPVRALTTTSEAFRRALQSLGLTVTDKKAGITKEQTEITPMDKFYQKMESGENDEIITKKPKKKVK